MQITVKDSETTVAEYLERQPEYFHRTYRKMALNEHGDPDLTREYATSPDKYAELPLMPKSHEGVREHPTEGPRAEERTAGVCEAPLE